MRSGSMSRRPWREDFAKWIAACQRDKDAPRELEANLLSADFEDIAESSRAIEGRLDGLLKEEPSWDRLETALYDVWSHLIHLVQHWHAVRSAVGDDDLGLESYLEGKGSNDGEPENEPG